MMNKNRHIFSFPMWVLMFSSNLLTFNMLVFETIEQFFQKLYDTCAQPELVLFFKPNE